LWNAYSFNPNIMQHRYSRMYWLLTVFNFTLSNTSIVTVAGICNSVGGGDFWHATVVPLPQYIPDNAKHSSFQYFDSYIRVLIIFSIKYWGFVPFTVRASFTVRFAIFVCLLRLEQLNTGLDWRRGLPGIQFISIWSACTVPQSTVNIWHRRMGRRRNHLWQIFWWSV